MVLVASQFVALLIRLRRSYLVATSFCNLATIDASSVHARLGCTSTPEGAYDALARHAYLFERCGTLGVDFDCWRRVVNAPIRRVSNRDLDFFRLWCRV